MPIRKGDFITIDYTCKVKESGELVDTTIEEAAEKTDLTKGHQEHEHIFEPQFVIVGEGWLPKGLDESLKGLKVKVNKTFEIPPLKGYGERDPSKIRLVPLRRFTKENVTPIPGMQVEIARKPALVRSVGAGRVQVDYNHPLSGKTLIYDVTVKRVLKTKSDKARALIHRSFPELDLEKIGLSMVTNEASIEIPDEAFFMEGLQLKKKQIASELQKYLKLKTVTFIERIKVAPPSKASPKKGSDLSGKKEKAR